MKRGRDLVAVALFLALMQFLASASAASVYANRTGQGLDSLPAWAEPLVANERVGTGVLETLADSDQARVVIVFFLPEDWRSEEAVRLGGLEHQDAVRSVTDDLLKLLPSADFELIRRYVAVRALAGRITLNGLHLLLQDESVEGVGLDPGGRGHLSEAVPLVNADDLQSVHSLTGSGITVAVLDSGYDTDHADLSDHLVGEQCYCYDFGAGCCPGGGTEQSGAGSAEDDHGHGTNVSGVITSKGSVAPIGSAPNAEIVAIKVLDENNSFCCATDVIAGLDWIIANRPDVDLVNMSLGTFDRFSGACDDGSLWWIEAWADAIDTLRDNGVLSFASSGNEGDKSMLPVPACITNTLAVGAVWDSDVGSQSVHTCTDATTAADKVTCWSNSNSMVDVFAPGAPMTAAGIGGGTSTFFGTSQASPTVAGCAALLKEGAPDLSADQLEVLLEGSTTIVTDSGNMLDFPRIDCLEAWEPCGYPLVRGLDGYVFSGSESIDACEKITVVDSEVPGAASPTLNAGRAIEIGNGLAVSGDLTLALHPAWAVNP